MGRIVRFACKGTLILAGDDTVFEDLVTTYEECANLQTTYWTIEVSTSRVLYLCCSVMHAYYLSAQEVFSSLPSELGRH